MEATPKEITAYCKNKYGSLYDWDFSGHQFENPKNTNFYRLVTMGGKLIPLPTTQTILSNNSLFESKNYGIYEVARNIQPLNSIKGRNIRFANNLTLENIHDLEEILNNTPSFSL